LNTDLNVKREDAADSGGPDFDGIDDRSMYCFLQAGLAEGTLRTELTDKDCTFLVNLIVQDNLKAVPYESFIDFIIPQSSKKVTTKLLKKIKRKDL
jgi:hypothetical protein